MKLIENRPTARGEGVTYRRYGPKEDIPQPGDWIVLDLATPQKVQVLSVTPGLLFKDKREYAIAYLTQYQVKARARERKWRNGEKI